MHNPLRVFYFKATALPRNQHCDASPGPFRCLAQRISSRHMKNATNRCAGETLLLTERPLFPWVLGIRLVPLRTVIEEWDSAEFGLGQPSQSGAYQGLRLAGPMDRLGCSRREWQQLRISRAQLARFGDMPRISVSAFCAQGPSALRAAPPLRNQIDAPQSSADEGVATNSLGSRGRLAAP